MKQILDMDPNQPVKYALVRKYANVLPVERAIYEALSEYQEHNERLIKQFYADEIERRLLDPAPSYLVLKETPDA